MTRRDRVKAALAHQPADRPPYFIHLCDDAWQALGERRGGMDVETFLGNDVRGVGIPWWNWFELAPDWSGFDPPTSPAKVKGCGSYPALEEDLKRLADSSDQYVLAMVYGSHFEKAYFARGIENCLADMAGSPDFARRFLARIVDKNMVMLENVLSLPGIDGVLLGSDWGTQLDLLMSPAVWDDMIRPGEQREYDLIHAYGKDVWIHSCGKIDKLIPRLVEMGVDVLNPVQPECMDIASLVRRHGPDITFWGGISTQRVLPFGTPDEVRADARRTRAVLGAHNGYILAPSQSIQSDVPPENLMALLDVARETPPPAAR
ncbi:MAG: methylcobalamin:coenzyme M methyltransferase [Lentisphaerae bacterium ADurb.BinA184]|nr:MAG: methylcobalamin:coenzyme M methyltransferase [Lentisphaerae bacterium ADurb.BinA184]